MIKINLADTQNRKVLEQKGNITVWEYVQDLSVNQGNAIAAYYASKMNIRKRQVVYQLDGKTVCILA